MDLLRSLELTLGSVLLDEIRHRCKVLLVGAGGIGCELLKNLALTGFRDVEVIDLDTIDVSNLNRQLLFRSHHVGQPKCVIACQAALALAVRADIEEKENVRYVAHHGNVCDDSFFNVDFVQRFDVILNALDNVQARRRVNRIALAANVPLIEAGTTGYLGQVSTIHKASQTACYECVTQETGTVYPICTIRSTPSTPVHCIVWAKELYKLFFGEKPDESMLFEAVEENDNNNDNQDKSTYMETVYQFRQLLDRSKSKHENHPDHQLSPPHVEEEVHPLAVKLLCNFYRDEIQKQLDMDRFKTAQKKPTVLSEQILEACTQKQTLAPTSLETYQQTDVWSIEECAAEFMACLQDAVAALSSSSSIVEVSTSFDKDDPLAMRFVTATANLRSALFGITPLQSYYSAKGIAGNIIPAIATTNAICAGLQILQCFRVLQARIDDPQKKKYNESLQDYCRYINCLRNPTRNGLFLTAANLEKPNPKCFVCQRSTIPLQIEIRNWNLHDFIQIILKRELGFQNPTIHIGSSDVCIWEEGDGADTETYAPNLHKPLSDLPGGGIRHGVMITIEDFTQDLEVDMVISNVEDWNAEEGGGEEVDFHKFVVGGEKPQVTPSASSVNTTTASNTSTDSSITQFEEHITKETKTDIQNESVSNGNYVDDDDDCIEVVNEPEGINGSVDAGMTNKRSATKDNEHPPTKRAKLEMDQNAEVIEID
jgi:ubiquitin-like 1-activating enzyme E1 B